MVDDEEVLDEVELSFPWLGGKLEARWPANEKSVMVSIIAILMALTIIIPTSLYVILNAPSGNVSEFGNIFVPKPVPTTMKLPLKEEP